MSEGELDLIRGTLEFLVLKTLSRGEEMHGFAILDWIRRITDDDLVVEEGALYPALHRMQRRGWLVGEWGISDKGRRAKYYRLTPAGREELIAQESHWDRYVEAVARIARAAER